MAGQRSRGSAPPIAASDGTTGVYGITVAAELAGMSVQALRLYERKGLLEPARTDGGTRRYSDTDIARLRRIGVLINDGINLAGIARVLGLETDNAGLRTRNADLKSTNAALRASNTELETDNSALREQRPRRRTGKPTSQPFSQAAEVADVAIRPRRAGNNRSAESSHQTVRHAPYLPHGRHSWTSAPGTHDGIENLSSMLYIAGGVGTR